MNGLKRYWIPVVVFVLLFGSVFAATPQTHAAAAQPPVSTLVAIRAAYHPAARPRYDRVVFEFSGPVPQIDPHPGYVKQLIGDGSGLPVPIKGKAIFELTMRPAQAHNATGATASTRIYPGLRNVQQIKNVGDFEAVLTYGIGLRHRSNVRVFTLTHPSRVVVDFLNP
jgi:hypothetical protein